MLSLGSPGRWKWKWTPVCPVGGDLRRNEFSSPDQNWKTIVIVPNKKYLLYWFDEIAKKRRWCCCWSASSFLLEWMTESSLFEVCFIAKDFMMFFFNRSTIPSYVQSIEIEKDIIIHCPVWFANRFLKFLAVAAYVGFFSVSCCCCVLFYLKRRFWLRRKN